MSHCSSHYRNLAVTQRMTPVPGDYTKQVSYWVSLFLAQFLASLLEAGTGTVLWFSGLGTAFVSLFGSCITLLRFYLFIFLQRSSLISHVPITIPTTVMNPVAMSWAPNHVPRAPLVLFCTLCPSSGQPFKTRLCYLHFADETTGADEITVTFLRLLIHSVAIWGFSLSHVLCSKVLSSVYPSFRCWTRTAGNRLNFQASECTR